MNPDIAALTAEQALRALLVFHDSLPAQSWARGQKPASANLRALAERLEEQAPSEVLQFIEDLRNEQNAEFKGTVAKGILVQLAANEMARPYVEQAICEATAAHMGIVRDFMFCMVALAALSQDIKTQCFEIHGRAPELVQQLTQFVKALPSGVADVRASQVVHGSPRRR